MKRGGRWRGREKVERKEGKPINEERRKRKRETNKLDERETKRMKAKKKTETKINGKKQKRNSFFCFKEK